MRRLLDEGDGREGEGDGGGRVDGGVGEVNEWELGKHVADGPDDAKLLAGGFSGVDGGSLTEGAGGFRVV